MKKTIAMVALTVSLAGTTAVAQDFTAQVKARQGQFRVLALNLGILGGMAKGEIDYSAEAASAAADSIVGVAMIHQPTLFPEGSDNMSIDGTRALPSIWDDGQADFLSKWMALGTAAQALKTAAAGGKDAIGPALGQIGGTCKACHEAHRAPN